MKNIFGIFRKKATGPLLATPEETIPVPQVQPITPITPKKILVLENTKEYWKIICEEIPGAKIVETLKEAENLLETEFFDGVVTDLFMPIEEERCEEILTILSETKREDTRRKVLNERLVQEAFGKPGEERPAGLLLAKLCKEKRIPLVVATDSNHHKGRGYVAIGAISTMFGGESKLYKFYAAPGMWNEGYTTQAKMERGYWSFVLGQLKKQMT